LKKVKKGKKG